MLAVNITALILMAAMYVTIIEGLIYIGMERPAQINLKFQN